ncbi:phosphotransferase family protein [Gorillibacterium massiliense]|uniref:phosphotransferase family protein n=1 Tax=Gorillibacterium massiliense TaxID=1280390 RepID=UPI0004BBDB8B|nr:aminoglycoside phosphotransferase family protein [Gorillibacterium massiliense]
MDERGERAIPFFAVDEELAVYLLQKWNPCLRFHQFAPLAEGKRTSNYRVRLSGDEGIAAEVILRIYPPNDESWRKEAALRQLLGSRVPLQRVHWIGQDERLGGRAYAILEYCPGESLLKRTAEGYVPDEPLMEQIGRALAGLHGHRYEQVAFLDGQLQPATHLPACADWFEMFLTPAVRDRLGTALCRRIEGLVLQYRDQLAELDRHPALVHGDFRATNLIVREGKLTGIVDWEFAMAGHPIADVGQLFRAGEIFSDSGKQAFIRSYNEHAAEPLPVDWEILSLLRDLVNLLQLMGDAEEASLNARDLKDRIERTVFTFTEDSISL